MDERRRQSVTVSAKTVDEAIAAAERELGVPRDRLDITGTLLRQMDIRGRVAIRTIGNPIVLDVETDNGGLLIGRRGDTLSALQYIVNVLVGKRTRRWTKVVVDVEHWRERREETLRA